ncbi:Flap-structured DNA-binding and RNA-binding protein [Yamadazyma tenuis]|uniref:RNA-binding protein VTS1 n=1 Tax=Candida tenuis (strain ATCC 10573 / BCRC 21748 / CBS 615 / JCM 9827 / NBRC 10315 / NRRL Y-1498 / VKM Y-70) TaxID=590646 RepID=G3B7F8_CANTC|nr:uncharacterized protein CANTEDRAFT_136197 [Yamadazyma tenuis ATCC 10573]EGV62266.1 hypothetical protein CANTEDRAFT_136197 [Yamadazyma tenuis ATCC 10573]WEJ93522.1 Flap-structured DNA-binding and RNA-binding protein [Yamadazyma tenuis]
MDSKQSSPFSARPIVLSPPPLSTGISSGSQGTQMGPEDSKLQDFLAAGHYNRQQSVGYNLQHEFETLNADLDLDLKDPRSAPATSQAGGFSVSSPVPTNINGSQAGLGSLLNSSFYSPLNLPHRSQTVADFSLSSRPTSSTSFYQELIQFTAWIENLSPQDNATMIEYLCSNLPVDILLSFRSKLEAQLGGQLLSPPHVPNQNTLSQVLSPYAYTQNQSVPSEVLTDLDHLNLSDTRTLHQPKPRPNVFRSYASTLGDAGPRSRDRPRSADPSLQAKQQPQYQQFQTQSSLHPGYQNLDRAKSPTSHMFEKTNFLQLAAQSPGLGPSQAQDEYEQLDMSQKLGALATINSRVALDSNKKNFGAYHDPTNRAINSSSVPLVSNKVKSPNQKPRSGYASAAGGSTATSTAKSIDSSLGVTANNSSPNAAGASSSMPVDVTNLELLKNIPAWLKLLRLHKYTDSLKDVPWKVLIELSDEQLEEKGVKALGARRKLLKAFDVIKAQYD